jgi:hypothetical protein
MPLQIFVRPRREADVASQGEPDNFLMYHFAWPGGQWNYTQVDVPGTTFSASSIFVRPTGEAPSSTPPGTHLRGSALLAWS